MLRKIACTMVALVICGGVMLADEIKAKVKSKDADKNTITVTVDDKDKTYTVSKDAEVYSEQKKKKQVTKVPVAGGLSGISDGADVTLTVDKDTVSSIKIEGEAKKKKKNK